MKQIKFKSFVRGALIFAVLGLFTFIFMWSRTKWIPAGNVGVIYDASEGLLPEVLKPQAVYVGWRRQLFIYPTKLMNALYTEDPTAGEDRSADGILVTTNDNANTTFDVSVIYRVLPENVIQVFNEFGAIPIVDVQTGYIRRATKEVANDISTQYDLFSLMGPKRLEASQKMTTLLRERMAQKGISVEIVMLGASYPSAEFQSKITSRVNSYIELEISRLKREIAEIERQVAIVKGEANNKAAQLSASQTKDRSIDLLKLQATEQALKKWDGKLPAISPKPGQNVIITSDILGQMGGRR